MKQRYHANIRIPPSILFEDLNGPELKVWILYWHKQYGSKEGWTWISTEDLSVLGFNIKTFRRARTSLIEKGLMTRRITSKGEVIIDADEPEPTNQQRKELMSKSPIRWEYKAVPPEGWYPSNKEQSSIELNVLSRKGKEGQIHHYRRVWETDLLNALESTSIKELPKIILEGSDGFIELFNNPSLSGLDIPGILKGEREVPIRDGLDLFASKELTLREAVIFWGRDFPNACLKNPISESYSEDQRWVLYQYILTSIGSSLSKRKYEIKSPGLLLKLASEIGTKGDRTQLLPGDVFQEWILDLMDSDTPYLSDWICTPLESPRRPSKGVLDTETIKDPIENEEGLKQPVNDSEGGSDLYALDSDDGDESGKPADQNQVIDNERDGVSNETPPEPEILGFKAFYQQSSRETYLKAKKPLNGQSGPSNMVQFYMGQGSLRELGLNENISQ